MRKLILAAFISGSFLLFSSIRILLPSNLAWKLSRALVKIPPVLSWMPGRPSTALQLKQFAWRIERKLGLRLNCLSRSLALHFLAQAFALRSAVKIGVTVPARAHFRAHAWLEPDNDPTRRGPDKGAGLMPFDKKIL